MRISVWQQFSSNHSSSFTLIATFETVEHAESTAKEARTLLRRVSEWYSQHYTEDERFDLIYNEKLLPLTPIEESLRWQGDFENWIHSIDWVIDVKPARLDLAVQVYRNLVLIQNVNDTWSGFPPFDEVVNYWAISSILTGEGIRDGGEIYLRAGFKAENAERAQVIAGQLQLIETRLNGSSRVYVQIPGHNKYEAKMQINDEQLVVEELPTTTFNFSGGPRYEVMDFLQHLESYAASQGCTDFDVSAYKTRYGDEVYDAIWVILRCWFDNEIDARETSMSIAAFTQPNYESETKPPWAGSAGVQMYLGEGKVSHSGKELRLEYQFQSIYVGLPAFLEWLRSRGTDDIDYDFETRSAGES